MLRTQENPDLLDQIENIDLSGMQNQANEWFTAAWAWMRDLISDPSFGWQALAIAAAAIVGYLLAFGPRTWLKRAAEGRQDSRFAYLGLRALKSVVWPIFMVILLWAGTLTFNAMGLNNELLRIAASLLNAWIVIRLFTSTVQSPFWSRTISLVAWTIAALYITRTLAPVRAWLDSVAYEAAGGYRLSLLQVIVAIGVTTFALWAGGVASGIIQSRLSSNSRMSPSMSGLLGQIIRIAFIILAFVIALSAIGINLTALAVIGGGLSVGIGFGLQAIFSNFISGIIILFEKSLKVGDYVQLESGVAGRVQAINIRSTLIRTNDNIDILVPNEQFIKDDVTNWTHGDARRRLRIPFGVAYGTDKELVKKAALEAAEAVPHTMKTPPFGKKTEVWLTGFGDSAIDFELVVWLDDDSVRRPGKVNADFNWAIHTALEKYDIEIPFPQRDLHIRSDQRERIGVSQEADNPKMMETS